MKIKKEVRYLTNQIEIRSEENQPSKIVGYALKFNRDSKPLLGYFVERLDPNCLNDTDLEECVALFNHDSNQVLGRYGNNLTLSVDDIGLRFEVTPTDTSYAKDLVENIRAGVIDKCSFAFTVPKDGEQWSEERNSDGYFERTITKIDKLYDVSVVTNPAYSDTEAVVGRSLDAIKNIVEQPHERLILDLDFQVYG